MKILIPIIILLTLSVSNRSFAHLEGETCSPMPGMIDCVICIVDQDEDTKVSTVHPECGQTLENTVNIEDDN